MTEPRINGWQGCGHTHENHHIMVSEGRETTQNTAEPGLNTKESEMSHTSRHPSFQAADAMWPADFPVKVEYNLEL